MKYSDKSATSRITTLLCDYITLLRKHGLSWILSDSQKVSVYHVLSAIRPYTLQNRLRDDLDFSHHHLKKDFKGFTQHVIKLAEAYQLVQGGGRKPSAGSTRDKGKTSRSGGGGDPPRLSKQPGTSTERSSNNTKDTKLTKKSFQRK